ncbi:MAG: glycosyltransferase [Anaerolineaceae bacterium]
MKSEQITGVPHPQHGLTILIACYNASSIIEKTLDCLMKMHKVPDFPWEVLLVDNNSTDDTVTLAKKAWHGEMELRIVQEERQGTGYAKFRGMQEARYAYIGVVDQDNWVDEDWMQKAVFYLDQAPKAAAIFGKGTPVFESNKPVWFDRYQQNYAVGPQYPTNGPVLDFDSYFYAAGSILRKEAFDRLATSGFEPLLRSRAGTQLLSGEDTELQILLRLIGWDLHYQEDLQFRHYMPIDRLSRHYFKRFRKGLGTTSVYLSLYRSYQKQRINQSKPLSQSWQSLLHKSFLKMISDPAAIAANVFPQYTANFRVVKFWSHYGEFAERVRLSSGFEKTRNQLYRWLDSLLLSSDSDSLRGYNCEL